MNRALCAGQWDLFDSSHSADHKEAADLCAVCPVLAWCRTERDRFVAEQRHSGKYGMTGTWAGRLYGAHYNPDRLRAEDAMFTDDEAREAHSAWSRGERDDHTLAGERAYQRRAKQRRKAVA